MKHLSGFALALAAATNALCAPAAWDRDPNFAPVLLHEISAASRVSLMPMANGRVFARGEFTHVSGHATSKLAWLRADGTVDPAFSRAASSEDYLVAAAPLPDGRALVVRQSFRVGVPTLELVRLSANGSVDPSFSPVSMEGSFNFTPLSDGRLLAWGAFSKIGDAARDSIARFNADGTLDATYAPEILSGSLHVTSVAAAADGSVYVSGETFARGGGEKHFLRLKPDGAIDPTFQPETPLVYLALAVQPDGKILGTTGRQLIQTLAPSGPFLYGDFVRLLPDGKSDPQFQRTFSGDVLKIAPLADGQIAVQVLTSSGATLPPTITAPSFAPVPEPPPHHSTVLILANSGAIELDLRSLVSADIDVQLLGLAADGQLLLRHGPVQRSDGLTFEDIVIVPPTPLIADIAVQPGPELTVPAATPSFAAAPPYLPAIISATLGRFSPDTRFITSLPPTFVDQFKGSVSRLATDGDGRVLMAGAFTSVNGQLRPGLARFLANGTLDDTYAPAIELMENSLGFVFVQPDGRVVVREPYLTEPDANGFRARASRLIRLRADGGKDSTFTPAPELMHHQTHWHLGASDGRVLVSFFTPDNNREENLRLAWLADNGSVATTLPTRFTGLDALATIGWGDPGRYANSLNQIDLLPGGDLLITGLLNRVLRLKPDGTVDPNFAADTSLIEGQPSSTLLPEGRLMISGRSSVSGRSVTLARRLLANGARDPSYADLILPGFSSFVWTSEGLPDLNYPTRRVEPWGGIGTPAGVIAGDGSLWTSTARYIPRETIGITVQPEDQTIAHGLPAHLQVAIGTTRAATYEWSRNGTIIPEAQSALLRIPAMRRADAGTYRVRVTIDGQTFTSEPAVLTLKPSTARLTNFSGRSKVTADSPQVIGFVTEASPERSLLVRAVGRGLIRYADLQCLPEPVLELHEHPPAALGGPRSLDRDRGGAQSAEMIATAARVGAFPVINYLPVFLPGESLGSALLRSFKPGIYTGTITAADARPGIALGEIYDAGNGETTPVLRNASVRGWTGPAEDVLTIGFIIAGKDPLRLLVRATGPTLTAYGVSNPVADPRLALFDSNNHGRLMLTNNDWAGDAAIAAAAAGVGAFPLPANSRDAAMLLTLHPGVYTIQVAAANEASGQVLAELYVVDPE